MKIDRLLGILVMLSKNEILTAPQLAEQFEVSKRTINRDIEALCMAGIPIITKQGMGGGIYIQEGYKLDKNIFKQNEMSEIATGLKALASINLAKDAEGLINKIIPKDINEHNEVVKIELGSFWKQSISEKIQTIKQAIDLNKCLSFTYFSKRGKSQKVVEPYYVIFKWDNWYLYGYSDGFRLYKLKRLWDLNIDDKEYIKREMPKSHDETDFFEDNYTLKAVFSSSIEYRLAEEYGNKSYTAEGDQLLFECGFANYDYMLSWVLSYGSDIEVIEPKELREDLKSITKSMMEQYQ